MIPIASLLNPCPSSFRRHRDHSIPRSIRDTPERSPPPVLPKKKQKLSKDAAIFAKGKTKGEVRYKPCEFQDEEFAIEYRRFQIFPMGKISQYCRHIPYNSEKKSFLEKTGRESFEGSINPGPGNPRKLISDGLYLVFQYTFRMPGEDREYTIMWDYNVGLVRITPFFKCCKWSKTTPAKMLNNNPGLREICHSITGGALAAQGYWMPFEAAKAIAATFCYSIRYALTPLFGLDFRSLCIKPEDPIFAHMVIDNKIVRQCAATARAFCTLSKEASHAGTPSIKSSNSFKTTKSPRANLGNPADNESGYGTDTDRSDKYFSSPQTPRWTALNTPTSSTRTDCGTPSSQKGCASRSIVKYEEPLKSSSRDDIRDGKRHFRGKDDGIRDGKRHFRGRDDGIRDGKRHSRETDDDIRDGKRHSRETDDDIREGKRHFREKDDDIRDGKRHSREKDYDHDQESSSSQSSEGLRKAPKRRRTSTIQTKESRAAAHMLMQLRLGDAAMGDSPNGPNCRQVSS